MCAPYHHFLNQPLKTGTLLPFQSLVHILCPRIKCCGYNLQFIVVSFPASQRTHVIFAMMEKPYKHGARIII